MIKKKRLEFETADRKFPKDMKSLEKVVQTNSEKPGIQIGKNNSDIEICRKS